MNKPSGKRKTLSPSKKSMGCSENTNPGLAGSPKAEQTPPLATNEKRLAHQQHQEMMKEITLKTRT